VFIYLAAYYLKTLKPHLQTSNYTSFFCRSLLDLNIEERQKSPIPTFFIFTLDMEYLIQG
jgi:hypothetical protein